MVGGRERTKAMAKCGGLSTALRSGRASMVGGAPVEMTLLSIEVDGLAPVCAQVAPCRIHGDDEPDLLYARPALQLLLTSNGIGDQGEALEIDELVDSVTRGMAGFVGTVLMLGDPNLDLGCNAYVELLKAARHDVYVGDFGHS
jgi:hypothetical protein